MQGASAVRDPLITRQTLPVVGVALAAAVCFGALAEARTEQAVIGLGAVSAVVIALWAPFVTITALLYLAVLVPFSVQNDFSVGGGTGQPGLLMIDILVAVALARLSVGYLRRGVPGSALVGYVVLLVAGVQLLHGIAAGAESVNAATELRRIAVATGGFLLALPLMASPTRRHLPIVLLLLGAALAASGLAQWLLEVEYNGSDFGVREGVGLTSAGTGQLQGGLFVYPVAVILSFAALVSGRLHGDVPWLLTAVVLGGNVVCLILTYERTFWGAAIIGCVFVLARLKATARWRALIWIPPVLTATLLGLALIAPGELRTAVERGASVSQIGSDSAVESRERESAGVLEKIANRPIHGDGLGADLTWTDVGADKPTITPYTHNGYLWLSWKTGIPFALLCVALLVASIARRRGPETDSFISVLSIAAQGSLLGLLVINVTFPSFNSLSAAAVTGLLLALCWVPRRSLQGRRTQTI